MSIFALSNPNAQFVCLILFYTLWRQWKFNRNPFLLGRQIKYCANVFSMRLEKNDRQQQHYRYYINIRYYVCLGLCEPYLQIFFHWWNSSILLIIRNCNLRGLAYFKLSSINCMWIALCYICIIAMLQALDIAAYYLKCTTIHPKYKFITWTNLPQLYHKGTWIHL